jgi:hypothetical protein
MKLAIIKVHRSFAIPSWDAVFVSRVVDYWRSRGMKFANTRGPVLEARRGSILGNLFSFDMSKLLTRLTISETSTSHVEAVRDVDSRYQQITEWNHEYWRLELETFESVVLRGDHQEERWRHFLKANRKAAIEWTATLGSKGHDIPPDEKL